MDLPKWFVLTRKTLYACILLVVLEVLLVESTFDICSIAFNFCVAEQQTVIIHKLSFCEVGGVFVCFDVQSFVHNFGSDADILMVQIVSHRDHTRVRQAPSETPGAHLRIKRHEVASSSCFLCKNISKLF